MNKQKIDTVLFDLDGTMLDTANDLIAALQSLAPQQTLTGDLRTAAGKGCKGLIKAGLDIDDSDTRYPDLANQLLQHYENCLLNTTQLFAGMEKVLDHLDKNNIPWGIVTNKPNKYTQLILDGLHLTKRAKCIISGDSLKHHKPHPEPILHACKLLNTHPTKVIYVGDSEVDVMACRAAGVPSLVALYGYISAEENPESWNANGYIKQPMDILEWVL